MYIVIFITAPSKKEANNIAGKLIQKKMAACVNIISNIDSLFWWKAKVDTAKEALLIVKTKKTKLAKIIALVKSLHSYDTPEIIALPIIRGEKKYLKWINDSVG
jgi:periplasmic divalent cation tolerance protein